MRTPTQHPKSDGFKWQRLSGPFRRLTMEQAEQFDEQGWFVLEDAFTAAEMDAIADAIAQNRDPASKVIEMAAALAKSVRSARVEGTVQA